MRSSLGCCAGASCCTRSASPRSAPASRRGHASGVRRWSVTRHARRSDNSRRSCNMQTASPPARRTYQFPRAISLSASISSSLSATIRFSRAFSRSSSRSRLASSAFIPPYWLRQRWQVCSEISTCFAALAIVCPSPHQQRALRGGRVKASSDTAPSGDEAGAGLRRGNRAADQYRSPPRTRRQRFSNSRNASSVPYCSRLSATFTIRQESVPPFAGPRNPRPTTCW